MRFPMGLFRNSYNVVTRNIVRSFSQFKPREPKVDFEKIAVRQEIEQQLIPVIEYLIDPSRFERKGIFPKGVLFSGPPGTGKSIMAEALAGHAGRPFFLVPAASLTDKYVGGTEEKLRELFSEAEKHAPCVLCFDEFDTLAAERQDGSSYKNDIVNQLLTLLIEDRSGVLVTATTNSKKLDPAVIRSGRFDRTINIDLPDDAERLKILQIHTRDIILHIDVDLENLANISEGLSGAQIATWVKEAHMQAVLHKKNFINLDNFMRTLLLVFESTAPQVQNDKKIRRDVAVHEAGHALIAHLLGNTPNYVSVMSSSAGSGHTRHAYPGTRNIQQCLDLVCVCLAGLAAEEIYNIESTGLYNDLTMARKFSEDITQRSKLALLPEMSKLQSVEGILLEQKARAIQLLVDNGPTMTRLIEELETHNYLFKADILAISAGNVIDLTFRTRQSNLEMPKKRIPTKDLPPFESGGLIDSLGMIRDFNQSTSMGSFRPEYSSLMNTFLETHRDSRLLDRMRGGGFPYSMPTGMNPDDFKDLDYDRSKLLSALGVKSADVLNAKRHSTIGHSFITFNSKNALEELKRAEMRLLLRHDIFIDVIPCPFGDDECAIVIREVYAEKFDKFIEDYDVDNSRSFNP